jgi:hypothetical protein
LTSFAHFTTTHARPRRRRALLRSRKGFPPRDFEKKVQSGENHARPTGRPPQTATGSTSKTSSRKWRVLGWLASCIASASASWLIAMSGERPSARSMPVDAPPPPAKLSTISSSAA